MRFNNPNFQLDKQAYNQMYKQIVEKSMNKMKKTRFQPLVVFRMGSGSWCNSYGFHSNYHASC